MPRRQSKPFHAKTRRPRRNPPHLRASAWNAFDLYSNTGIAPTARALYNCTMIFHVTMEQSEGWYVVECPALPGCVSQGRDEKEALENIQEAIVGWLWAEERRAHTN